MKRAFKTGCLGSGWMLRFVPRTSHALPNLSPRMKKYGSYRKFGTQDEHSVTATVIAMSNWNPKIAHHSVHLSSPIWSACFYSASMCIFSSLRALSSSSSIVVI